MRWVRKRIALDFFWLALLMGILAYLPINQGVAAPRAQSTPVASERWWQTTYDACDAVNNHEFGRAEAMFTEAVSLAGSEPTFLVASLESLANVKRQLGKNVEADGLTARAAQLRYAHPGLSAPYHD